MEYKKFYHDEHDIGELLKARNGGLLTDEGEAWRYQYTHLDSKGKYDLLYRMTGDLDKSSQTDDWSVMMERYDAIVVENFKLRELLKEVLPEVSSDIADKIRKML